MVFSVVEGAALLVVSLVWYWSMLRVVREGRARPFRPAVTTVLCAGHLVGMSLKLSEAAATGAMDPLFWLHGFNFLVVFVDLRLTAYYARGRHSLREPVSEDAIRAAATAAARPALATA